MAQAEYVIMQFVIQSDKHHVNPYYYHSGTVIHYNLHHLKDVKMVSLSAREARLMRKMHIYAVRYRLHSTNAALQK